MYTEFVNINVCCEYVFSAHKLTHLRGECNHMFPSPDENHDWINQQTHEEERKRIGV
jgi:hypothetical protein